MSQSRLSTSPLLLPLLLLGGWALLNALQISFTELFHDEAYYWTWSLYPAWGYAEHPPMVAWIIGIGTAVLPGEWGVRLISWLLHLLCLLLLWEINERKNLLTFCWVGVSIIGMHVAGFLAVPDSPYLFFIAFFFWRYKHFLSAQTFLNSLLLTLAIAGVLYSKYHGMMVLGMVWLSNLSLMRKPAFWAVVGGAALLLLPLLNWLVAEEFATFRFHLGNRVQRDWDWSFVGNFIAGQFGLMGPVLGIFGWVAAARTERKDAFTRSLIFTFWGVMAFLGFMSFRTWIEANWSAGAIIPLFLLTVNWLSQKETAKKWALRLAGLTFVIAMIGRTYLMVDFLTPLGIPPFRQEVHGWKDWAQTLKKAADGTPCVFLNTYARPSKYAFYAGEKPYAVNIFTYHHTQYDELPLDEELRGKKVYFVSTDSLRGLTYYDHPASPFTLVEIPNFQPFRELQLKPETLPPLTGDRICFSLTLENHYGYPIDLAGDSTRLPVIWGYFRKNGVFEKIEILTEPLDFVVEDEWKTEVCIHLPKEPGKYQFALGLRPKAWQLEYGTWVEMVEIEATE